MGKYAYGCIVDMEVGFFDALAVVPLGIGESKESFLEECTATGQKPEPYYTFKATAYSSSFQKLKPMFSKPWVSQTPAIPSSPHRNARDRAWSWGKSAQDG